MAVQTPVAPFRRTGEHFAIDLPGAQVVFTTRNGGASDGPYTSLNLGYLTDDDPGAVAANRAGLEDEFAIRLGFVHQVHGSRVRRLTSADAERERAAGPGGLTRADGQVTTTPGLAAAALTADCLAMAIAGDGAVAMVHGGWRGLHGGVIATAVTALRGAGVSGPLAAAIGPGAGPCCYEVGAEVHEAFADRPATVHAGANLDLPAIARDDLAAAGVDIVHTIGLCTICADPGLFFSHRRDRGVTGRQAGIAWCR
ncbi:MAG: polyphenol oxidase family protein [Actinomycetota bacterium]|nr:polyphenol oxidase family protein [Actinomycetota bacterium]